MNSILCSDKTFAFFALLLFTQTKYNSKLPFGISNMAPPLPHILLFIKMFPYYIPYYNIYYFFFQNVSLFALPDISCDIFLYTLKNILFTNYCSFPRVPGSNVPLPVE